MKPSNFVTIILCISGLIAISVASMILISPVDFYSANQIEIAGNVNLLNEIRASSGALLTYGIVILTGAFISQLTFTSTIMATLLYLSYGFSRIIGMVIDGLPTDSLIWSDVIENYGFKTPSFSKA